MTMMPHTNSLNKHTPVKLQSMTRNCTAILWLKTPDSDSDAGKVIAELSDMAGIQGVRVAIEHPTIVIVDYCLKQIRVAQMVSTAAQKGFFIRQIGC